MCNILIWNNYRHSMYDRAFLVVRQIVKELSSILKQENFISRVEYTVFRKLNTHTLILMFCV